MEQLDFQTDERKIDIGFLQIFVDKFYFWLKSGKNNKYLTWRPKCVNDSLGFVTLPLFVWLPLLLWLVTLPVFMVTVVTVVSNFTGFYGYRCYCG